MTTADTFNAEPAAFENAVFKHRLDHVLTARWRVTARWGSQGRYEHPVEIDREQERLAHVNQPTLVVAIFFRALHIAFSMTA